MGRLVRSGDPKRTDDGDDPGGSEVRKTNAAKSKPDETERALVAVKKAVGRLVRLLGDEDPVVIEKAALALAGIGPFVVGPLASALPRSPSPRHRMAILGALATFGPQERRRQGEVVREGRTCPDRPPTLGQRIRETFTLDPGVEHP